jgi:hypothetical protein
MMTIVRINNKRVALDDSLQTASVEAIKENLQIQYPEIQNAMMRVRTENDTRIVEFVPQAGKKG